MEGGVSQGQVTRIICQVSSDQILVRMGSPECMQLVSAGLQLYHAHCTFCACMHAKLGPGKKGSITTQCFGIVNMIERVQKSLLAVHYLALWLAILKSVSAQQLDFVTSAAQKLSLWQHAHQGLPYKLCECCYRYLICIIRD